MFKSQVMPGLKKSSTRFVVEIIEYSPGGPLRRSLVNQNFKKTTVSTQFAEISDVFTQSSDTFVQTVEGNIYLHLNDRSYELRLGEGVIIPAFVPHFFHSINSFRMVYTVMHTV